MVSKVISTNKKHFQSWQCSQKCCRNWCHLHVFIMAYYKTKKAGTRNSGTRNTAEQWQNNWTLHPEHQRNTPKYQRNTNVTPVKYLQNNGTIQNNSGKPVKLCPSPKTIRTAMIFWQFQGVQKSDNPFKRTHGWILFNAPRLNIVLEWKHALLPFWLLSLC